MLQTRGFNKRVDLVAIAGMIALLLLGACGEVTPTPAAISTTVSTTSKETRVAFIPPAFTSPFHVAVKDGAVKVSSQLGWKIDVAAAEKEGDFAAQVAIVEQMVQKKVNALAVTPMDVKAIIPAIKKANTANIPVLVPNFITPIEGVTVSEYIGYNQWSGGSKLGEYACKLLNGQGNVFILAGLPGFYANRRTGGFKAALAKTCPAVKIVGEQTAEWEREKAVNVATAALQKYPDIKLFYGNSDEMDIGACIAAKNIGKKVNQDIYCIGIDGNAATLDLIEKGDVTATLGVYPEKIGETTINQMAKLLKGEKIPAILETPSTVVDARNLADYKAGKTWTEPKEGRPELDNGQSSDS